MRAPAFDDPSPHLHSSRIRVQLSIVVYDFDSPLTNH
jgi:hypothetical protein